MLPFEATPRSEKAARYQKQKCSITLGSPQVVTGRAAQSSAEPDNRSDCHENLFIAERWLGSFNKTLLI